MSETTAFLLAAGLEPDLRALLLRTVLLRACSSNRICGYAPPGRAPAGLAPAELSALQPEGLIETGRRCIHLHSRIHLHI